MLLRLFDHGPGPSGVQPENARDVGPHRHWSSGGPAWDPLKRSLSILEIPLPLLGADIGLENLNA